MHVTPPDIEEEFNNWINIYMEERNDCMNHTVAKSKELAILVYSCWKNSDMWPIFMQLFNKYWADCMCQVILLTDKTGNKAENYGFDKVVVLDGTWKEMISAGIKAAQTGYVMLWMDDYLLCDYVRNEDIVSCLSIVRRYDAANIRLIESASIKAKTYAEDNRLNCYKAGTAYSFSTQIGIWNAALLEKYIQRYRSPWDFERKGSVEIIDSKHPLLAPKSYTFPYEEGVRRGKWMDNGVRLCKRNNIPLDFRIRKQMSSFELAWIYFKGGILELNPTLIVKVQNYIAYIKKLVIRRR